MALKVISTIQKRPDCVMVTVENSDMVVDSTTGQCQAITITYNPATGLEHLKKKVSQAFFEVQEKKPEPHLATEIKTAVEAIAVKAEVNL